MCALFKLHPLYSKIRIRIHPWWSRSWVISEQIEVTAAQMRYSQPKCRILDLLWTDTEARKRYYVVENEALSQLIARIFQLEASNCWSLTPNGFHEMAADYEKIEWLTEHYSMFFKWFLSITVVLWHCLNFLAITTQMHRTGKKIKATVTKNILKL